MKRKWTSQDRPVADCAFSWHHHHHHHQWTKCSEDWFPSVSEPLYRIMCEALMPVLWTAAPWEATVVAPAHKKIVELECSLPYSQDPATEPYIECIQTMILQHIFLKTCLNFILLSLPNYFSFHKIFFSSLIFFYLASILCALHVSLISWRNETRKPLVLHFSVAFSHTL